MGEQQLSPRQRTDTASQTVIRPAVSVCTFPFPLAPCSDHVAMYSLGI